MVLVFVSVLVAFDAAPEIDFSCQFCIAHNIHCMLYGRKADFGIFFLTSS